MMDADPGASRGRFYQDASTSTASPPRQPAHVQNINGALPDLLNSHVLPPYTAPRQNQRRFRIRTDRAPAHSRHSSRTCSLEPVVTQTDDHPKDCCSRHACVACVTVSTKFKWVLVGLAVLGILCVLTGIVLGALHMSVGSSFLTLSLMFIGLGVMLVIVVGIGWRCTPAGHEPCHLLFGIGSHGSSSQRNSRSGRTAQDRNHWFGGVMYPEFRFRRPPPTYTASMQDYQQQLVLAQLAPNSSRSSTEYILPASPPPTYKSRAGTIRPGLHITFPPQSGGEYPSSGPPTYRSRASDTSERPSLLVETFGNGQRVVHLAQMEDLTPSSGAASCFSQGTLTENIIPPSRLSTLHRVQQAVKYLDNIIETQRTDSISSRASRSGILTRYNHSPGETLESGTNLPGESFHSEEHIEMSCSIGSQRSHVFSDPDCISEEQDECSPSSLNTNQIVVSLEQSRVVSPEQSSHMQSALNVVGGALQGAADQNEATCGNSLPADMTNIPAT